MLNIEAIISEVKSKGILVWRSGAAAGAGPDYKHAFSQVPLRSNVSQCSLGACFGRGLVGHGSGALKDASELCHGEGRKSAP